MSIREFLSQREELDALIESELRRMKNWNSSCDCDKVITAELIRYGDPEDGGPAMKLESHCIHCGGFVDWQ